LLLSLRRHGASFFRSGLTLYDADTSEARLSQGCVIKLRSFLLVKTEPGLEKDVLDRFRTMSEIREIHLITGKFDLLVALESEETELDPRRKIAEVVIEKVRKPGGIRDTSTIIPIDSHYRPTTLPPERPTAKGFVFIQSETGKERGLMNKLLEIPEARSVHLLFGKSDLLVELEVEKSFIAPPPRRLATIVEDRISKFTEVKDTQTFVPLESIIK